jgi:hypothetical protein
VLLVKIKPVLLVKIKPVLLVKIKPVLLVQIKPLQLDAPETSTKAPVHTQPPIQSVFPRGERVSGAIALLRPYTFI